MNTQSTLWHPTESITTTAGGERTLVTLSSTSCPKRFSSSPATVYSLIFAHFFFSYSPPPPVEPNFLECCSDTYNSCWSSSTDVCRDDDHHPNNSHGDSHSKEFTIRDSFGLLWSSSPRSTVIIMLLLPLSFWCPDKKWATDGFHFSLSFRSSLNFLMPMKTFILHLIWPEMTKGILREEKKETIFQDAHEKTINSFHPTMTHRSDNWSGSPKSSTFWDQYFWCCCYSWWWWWWSSLFRVIFYFLSLFDEKFQEKREKILVELKNYSSWHDMTYWWF